MTRALLTLSDDAPDCGAIIGQLNERVQMPPAHGHNHHAILQLAQFLHEGADDDCPNILPDCHGFARPIAMVFAQSLVLVRGRRVLVVS